MRVAVLQRDLVFSRAIEQVLDKGGYQSTLFDDGLSLTRALSRSSIDMLILDWHASRLSGIDVLRSTRAGGDTRLPILFASSDGSEASIVRALSTGADDYVLLPARALEFQHRIGALLRRAYPERHGAVNIDAGPYHFNVRRQLVTLNGEPVALSGTQYRLASLFFSNIGRVLSRDHIFAMVWGREFRECTRTIDSHVSRLRTLLEIESHHQFRLQPVYKSGYRLVQLSGAERNGQRAASGDASSPVAQPGAARAAGRADEHRETARAVA